MAAVARASQHFLAVSIILRPVKKHTILPARTVCWQHDSRDHPHPKSRSSCEDCLVPILLLTTPRTLPWYLHLRCISSSTSVTSEGYHTHNTPVSNENAPCPQAPRPLWPPRLLAIPSDILALAWDCTVQRHDKKPRQKERTNTEQQRKRRTVEAGGQNKRILEGEKHMSLTCSPCADQPCDPDYLKGAGGYPSLTVNRLRKGNKKRRRRQE